MPAITGVELLGILKDEDLAKSVYGVGQRSVHQTSKKRIKTEYVGPKGVPHVRDVPQIAYDVDELLKVLSEMKYSRNKLKPGKWRPRYVFIVNRLKKFKASEEERLKEEETA